MAFRLWTHADNTEFVATPTFTVGDGSFGTGVYSRLSLAVRDDFEQTIPIRGNVMKLVSLNVWPHEATAQHVFGPLSSLVAAYQDNGNVFIPPSVNTIGRLVPTAGYRVFCTEAETLHVTGIMVNPTQEYHLRGGPWNWISYPQATPADVEGMLALIAEHLVIIQDDEGHAWIPGEGINPLHPLLPGKGYMLIVDQTMELHFPPIIMESVQNGGTDVGKPADAPPQTGLPYQVVVNVGEALRQNAQTVSLYDGELCVGMAYVSGQSKLAVTAWQGIPDQHVSGFVPGHAITAIFKDASGQVIPASVSAASAAYGSGAYAELTANVGGATIPGEFVVGEGYPNPFNPSVSVPFTITQSGVVDARVTNTLGQTVFHSRQNYDVGEHRFIFDSNQLSRSPVSGLYFIQLRYSGKTEIRKALLIR